MAAQAANAAAFIDDFELKYNTRAGEAGSQLSGVTHCVCAAVTAAACWLTATVGVSDVCRWSEAAHRDRAVSVRVQVGSLAIVRVVAAVTHV